MTSRIIAIDWSGNKEPTAQRRHIWLADWHWGAVTLSSGRTREETVQHVMDAARESRELIVGFDFAFSYPAWFLREQGCGSVTDLWRQVATLGETWLRACEAPFWGRPGKPCPPDHRGKDHRGFRHTERAVHGKTGRWPTSPFQIGGAGAVGTGSMRGMPCLLALQKAGLSIWPFDPPRPAAAIEIYPRLSVGKTRVSQVRQREAFLEHSRFRLLSEDVLKAARASTDAFDALCALMGMVEHGDELVRLQQATDAVELLEGRIWMPRQM